MKVIFKYEIGVGYFELRIPALAEVVHVDTQGTVAQMWVLQSTHLPLRTRRFQVFGTGESMPDNVKHLGTWQELNGKLVWHLVELLPQPL